MTRQEWVAHQIGTGLSPERAEDVAAHIELVAHIKAGREIEDWVDLPRYLHATSREGVEGAERTEGDRGVAGADSEGAGGVTGAGAAGGPGSSADAGVGR